MDDLVEGWPFWAVYAFFLVVVLVRSNATYWAGRGLRAGSASSSRLAGHLDRPAVVRTEAVVRRWGAVAVTLSFLTIGAQTLVNAAAGALRMPLRRYLPANVLGSLAWAGIYTTVGFAVVEAWLGGSWLWLALAVLLVLVVVVVSRVVRSRVARD